MAEVIKFGVAIYGINIGLLLFAIFTFKVGRKIHHSGTAIMQTGVAPAGSGFYGGLERDVKTYRAAGCFFTLISYCWFAIGTIILAVLAILDIVVIVSVLRGN